MFTRNFIGQLHSLINSLRNLDDLEGGWEEEKIINRYWVRLTNQINFEYETCFFHTISFAFKQYFFTSCGSSLRECRWSYLYFFYLLPVFRGNVFKREKLCWQLRIYEWILLLFSPTRFWSITLIKNNKIYW